MTGTGKIHKRVFGANSRSVSSIDDWVMAIAVDLGIDGRTAFAGRVCIAELADNVIEHGSPAADDQIVLSIGTTDGAMNIEFQDTVRAFDPTTIVGRPPHSEAYEGGRGLMIVKSYSDTLEYWHDGHRNNVKLRINPSNRRR
jgi:anti-sigma regulatory factor (Ser/Thr protein kinase)